MRKKRVISLRHAALANEAVVILQVMQARKCSARSAMRYIRDRYVRGDQGQRPKFEVERKRNHRPGRPPLGARKQLRIERDAPLQRAVKAAPDLPIGAPALIFRLLGRLAGL